MSTFGSQQEVKEFGPRIIYVGVENFRVRNCNLNAEEAKALYGDNAKEQKYTGEGTVNDKEVPQVMLKFICDNDPEEGEDKIFVEPTFWVLKAPHISQNKKTKYINHYGDTMWLTKEDADKKLPEYVNKGAKGEYVFSSEGMRPAYKGEEEFIKFLRNLLNLPSRNSVIEEDGDLNTAKSAFSVDDWSNMFNGNFTAVKQISKNSTNKIGLLLGAKRSDDKVYQDVFTRSTLRQWVKGSNKDTKYQWLAKDLTGAQQAGAYSNTDFGGLDFTLIAYNQGAEPAEASKIQGGFGGKDNQAQEDQGTIFDADQAEDYFESESTEAQK